MMQIVEMQDEDHAKSSPGIVVVLLLSFIKAIYSLGVTNSKIILFCKLSFIILQYTPVPVLLTHDWILPQATPLLQI